MDTARIKPSMPNSGNLCGDVLAGILTLFVYCLIATKMNSPWAHITKKADALNTTSVLWEIPVDRKLMYAEANPALPENAPDQTDLISTKDQQAAQPLDSVDLSQQPSPLPQLNGSTQNLKVVSASTPSHKEEPRSTSTVTQPAQLAPVRAAHMPQVLNDPILDQGKEGHSFQPKETSQPTEKKIINLTTRQSDGTEDLKTSISPSNVSYQRQRPALNPSVTNGPLLSNKKPAPRVGKVGIECKLNPFGVYVQKMLSAIEQQWYQLIIGSRSYIQYDQFPRKIIFKFSLLSSGKIDALTQIEENTSNLGVELCRQAIASRSPFGEWDEEMINSFGHSDEVTITFEYK